MARVFHRSTNTLARVSVFGFVFVLAGLAWATITIGKSAYLTNVSVAQRQPVPFSHEHHVNGVGLDCRYCHSSVEKSAFAGMPATQVCMNCHSQIWSDSPTLQPVRESYRTGVPLVWTRVYNLAEFAYFDHSIHIHQGIGCSTCHGRVDQMPLTFAASPMFMEWCLECHRNVARYVRPRTEVFNMNWTAPQNQLTQGKKLIEEYHIKNVRSLTVCSTCHR